MSRIVFILSIILAGGYFLVFVLPYNSLIAKESGEKYSFVLNQYAANPSKYEELPILFAFHADSESALSMRNKYRNLDTEIKIIFIEAKNYFKTGKKWIREGDDVDALINDLKDIVINLNSTYGRNDKFNLLGEFEGVEIALKLSQELADQTDQVISYVDLNTPYKGSMIKRRFKRKPHYYNIVSTKHANQVTEALERRLKSHGYEAETRFLDSEDNEVFFEEVSSIF